MSEKFNNEATNEVIDQANATDAIDTTDINENEDFGEIVGTFNDETVSVRTVSDEVDDVVLSEATTNDGADVVDLLADEDDIASVPEATTDEANDPPQVTEQTSEQEESPTASASQKETSPATSEVEGTEETPNQPEQGSLSQLMGLSAFSAFNPFASVRGGGGGSGKPSISLVYTARNGKRLSVSNTLFNLLGKPAELAIALTENELALGGDLPMQAQKYAFSPDKHSNIIYRSEVVAGIVAHFGLDFTGKSSMAFTNIRMDSFTNADGVSVPVAIVTIK